MKQRNIINLDSILDLSARLNETYDEKFILNTAMLSLMGKLRIIRAAVFLPYMQDTYKLMIAKGKKEIELVPYFELNSFRELNPGIISENILIKAGYQYCLPVKHQNEVLALICLGKRMNGNEYTTEERNYSWIVSSVAATALKNTYNHNSLLAAKTDLEQRNQLLTTMFEMNREFSTLLSKKEIVRMLSYRLMGQLAVTRFSLILFDDGNAPATIINRFPQESSDELIREISDYKSTIFSDNENLSEKSRIELQKIGIDVISPMTVQGNIKGILLVGKKMTSNMFSEDDVLFVEALGNTAIVALENERLFQQEIIKKQLENELNLALEIQKNLLPKELPDLKRFDLSGISIPSRQVGGDYYDIIKLSENRILIAIADVSGKGMPASLLMANIQAALRVLAPLSLDLKDMVKRLNNIVFVNTSAEKFVTFFCGELDIDTGALKYVNAGHNPPYVYRNDNTIEELTIGGMILGFLDEEASYHEGETKIYPGDSIIMFTDGVTEAMDKDHNEFEERRLKTFLPSIQNYGSEQFLIELVKTIKDFTGDNPQYDDLTAIALKCLE